MINFSKSPWIRGRLLLLLIFALQIKEIVSQCANYAACDPRCNGYCLSQSSTTNLMCCENIPCAIGISVAGFTSNFYGWLPYGSSPNYQHTCSAYCPAGQYADGVSGYCQYCNSWCQTCSGAQCYQCTSCSQTAYQLNSTGCYDYPYDSTLGYANTCPDGYYGLQVTMTCVACTTGCATCNLYLTTEVPGTFSNANYFNQNGNNCPLDSLCSYALKCYSCNSGYTLVEGFCLPNTQCFTYSKYTSASLVFDPDNCVCFPYYQLIGLTICTMCDISCLTCSGTQCVTCPDGATLSGGACSFNATYVAFVTGIPTASISSTSSPWSATAGTPTLTATANCSQATYVFGYFGYDLSSGANLFPDGATISYSQTNVLPANHYGIRIRAVLLFIDNWANNMSIIFQEGGLNRFSFDYEMEGIAGQYLCGKNYYDHQDVVDNWFNHTSQNVDLTFSSNTDGYAWGVTDLTLYYMLCDSTCVTCNGPTSSQCTSCSAILYLVLNNGFCVCDTASGYYMLNGACTLSCNPSYQNPAIFLCQSSCSFPYPYKYINPSNGLNQCVMNCPSGYYQYYPNMSCINNCYNSQITNPANNYYLFNGTDQACYQTCPSNTFGDPTTGYCVNLCPTFNSSTTDGYFSLNGYCYTTCSSTTYAYVPQRACLSTCPDGYYKNVINSTGRNVCEQRCTQSLKGSNLYGNNATGYCVNSCPANTYGDIQLNLCVQYCNATSFAQSLPVNATVANSLRTCVQNCSLNDDLYGNPLTGFCVQPLNCPTNYYADPLNFQCTLNCSGLLYFGDNLTHLCTENPCSSGWRQNSSKICVKTCLNNDTYGIYEYGDNSSGYCVAICPDGTFADRQYNMECVITCSATPSPSFGQNNICVFNCTGITWADPWNNRLCVTSCSNNPTYDTYGFNATNQCVTTCPDKYFAQRNVTGMPPLCDYGCLQIAGQYGEFGNVLDNRCEPYCPQPYYGDATGNRTCVLLCPWPYYAMNCTQTAGGVISISNNRVCVLDCSLCGWADNSSQTCAWNSGGCENGTFAHETNHQCVIPTRCNGYGDPVSRNCIWPCLVNSTIRYFADNDTKTCVLVCPFDNDTFGDNATGICGYLCTNSTVRDPQNGRRCVTLNNCTRSPLVLYGDSTKNLCVTALNCTTGTYGDNNTFICVTYCQGPTLLYSDNVTQQCVAQCQLGWYALNTTTNSQTNTSLSNAQGICSPWCPVPLYADNLTVTCTSRCSTNTYGVNFTNSSASISFYTYFGVCEQVCPYGQFARDFDNMCVYDCGSGLWGDNISRTCKTAPSLCPQGYYADNKTNLCVVPLNCSINGNIQYVADNLTQSCVSICPSSVQNFADMSKFLCVAVCPQNYYGLNSTLTCVSQCLDPTTGNTTFDGSYADFQLRICVKVCSAAPISTFGENVTFTCVQPMNCPSLTWAQVVVYSRQCVPHCPAPNTNSKANAQLYADNTTTSCVSVCPIYSFSDLSSGYGMCTYICPTLLNGTLQFADNSTKTCVTVCPIGNGTFGDNSTLACVNICPDGTFAQSDSKRYCVAVCNPNTWGETVRKTCVTSPLLCPMVNNTMYYAENNTHLCVQTCPSAYHQWGQNTTGACLTSCLLPSGLQSGYEWNLTRVCIKQCPPQLGQDGSYSDQGMCYYVCMTPGYYRDPQANRSCGPTCSFSPLKQYADSTTMRCVPTCPSYPIMYYAYDPLMQCVTTCPNSYRKYDPNNTCVATCPNFTFFNPDTYQCVQICPLSTSQNQTLYGNTYPAEMVCVTASNCPTNTYADSNVGLCVQRCTKNQWISSYYCVEDCPNGQYGDPTTGFCVTPTNCASGYYADNLTWSCVQVCPGTFADTVNKVCVPVCPSSPSIYFADPSTGTCELNCATNASLNLHQNLANQTCVSACAPNLYIDPFSNICKSNCSNLYYADNSTRSCVAVCPATPPLFGQNNTYTCVPDCLVSTQFRDLVGRTCVTVCPNNYFRDNNTRNCLSSCSNTSYADSASLYCVYNCTPQYASDLDNTCVSECPAKYFRDPTTYRCVQICPDAPVQYFQIADSFDPRCATVCPTGSYRDYLTYTCVSLCPPSPPTYADIVTGSCLQICSINYFAYSPERTCVSSCPTSYFAENYTRTCVTQCNPETGLFGDPNLQIPACVSACSPGTYSDPYTQTCKYSCITNPRMYGYYNGNLSMPIRQCVYNCPYPYVGDNTTGFCYLSCTSSLLPYIDQASQTCVATCSSLVYAFTYMPNDNLNGTCVKFCPSGTFADYSSLSCVSKCPNGLYGEATNNTCYANCTLANNKYADPTTNLCVTQCPHNSTFSSYADQFSRQCVTACPAYVGTVADLNIWKCVPRCTLTTQFNDPTTGTCVNECPSGYFADITTQTCVTNCSLYSLQYGYQANRTCVTKCPVLTLYADDQLRLCVNATSCPTGFYGLNSSLICVAICPTTPDLYGDPISKTCVYSCLSTYFADPSTRTCVQTCPTIPSLFSNNASGRCVQFCPNNSYADNYTRRCIGVCSIVPIKTFADSSTNQCVAVCPILPNYFASNASWACVQTCPSTPNMFADWSTRSCVLNCPGLPVSTYAYTSTRTCVKVCPGNYYMENSTRTCVTICLTGYADPQSKFCIAVCPNYTYGSNNSNILTCVTDCPTISGIVFYAEDNNNMCMSSCLLQYNTFRDPSSLRCVKVCPISQGFFAQPSQRICVSQCPQSPLSYADNSTRSCVSVCPKIPAQFAINSSRVCTAVCPNTTWADNNSRICLDLCYTNPQSYGQNQTWSCVTTCPLKPLTYADNSTWLCVVTCPSVPDMYADNTTQKCVYLCPNGTFADNTTRECATTCPQTYFAQNSSRRCVLYCPWKEFADVLLRKCVAKCSVDPIYYGNPITLACVTQCPASSGSFGNPLTQECVNYQANGSSGCNQTYYGDNSTRLCVQVCPFETNTYGDNSTWSCVTECPAGIYNTFADNSTMRCVSICPSYPEFYAEVYSRRCVHYCLPPNSTFSGSFSDNSTRTCTQVCPSTPDYYSDNSTLRCVFYCPHDPLTYADNSTRRCVTVCPSAPDIYGDPKTLRCVQQCPRDQNTFADPTTRLCVKYCPSNPPLYAENVTLRCLEICPNNSYADNSTQKCVKVCPLYPETYGDPSTNKCVVTCPSSPDLYNDPTTQLCVSRCPTGYYADNITRRCLTQCPNGVVNYADNLTNRCVSLCPASQNTYGDNQTRTCVLQCPLDPFTYADNITRMCLSGCNNVSGGGYAENVSRICVQNCPGLSYGDILNRICVRYCPDGWFAYTVDNLCVTYCQSPYYADNSTWQCVLVCPALQSTFGQSVNRTCTPYCPNGTYASQETQTCVVRCPNSSQTILQYNTYGLNSTNQCVSECPYPLYGYPVAQVCVIICPNPYYQNVTDHLCYLCPLECASCVNPLTCLTCNVGHYLYSGACVESCPTFPVVTYANPNLICGTASQCTQGYYAVNTTKSCVKTCPSGFFKNILMQTCDACIKGCVLCYDASTCQICNTNSSLWDNYVCYIFCSKLKNYYSATGCVSTCPTGTYLNLTTCLSCSSACQTCVISAQNCLICASGLYSANNLCVSQCPSGTKAMSVNGSLTCVSCQVTNCKTQPLTYSVTQFVNNFQQNVQVQFNQPVNITQQIDQVIQIQQKTVSRLLVQTYQYLDYTIVDYGNGLYNFILNNYDPSSNSQLEVQILQPNAIQSSSGELPAVTRTSLSVNTASFFTLDDYNPALATVTEIFVVVAFVLLVLTFWTNHSIWMPIYDYMQLILALILVNINYPPNLLYTLQSLLGSAFSFLPNFFTSTIPKIAYVPNRMNANIYSILEDASFLRVIGSIYFILIITGVVFGVVFILSKRAPNKQIKKWAKQFVRQTFWKKHLEGLVHVLFFPVFLFGIFGMRLYSIWPSSAIFNFSIFSSYLFMLAFLVAIVFYCYKLRKFMKDYPTLYLMIQKAYNFINYQNIILLENKNNYFTYQKNEVDLTDARAPRINDHIIFPFPIETKVGVWELVYPLFNYGHKLLTAIFLTISFTNPVIQLLLLLLLNIAFVAYVAYKRPFFKIGKREFNNQIYIHNLIVISICQIIILVYVFLYTQLPTQTKVLVTDFVCGIFLYGLVVNIIYFYHRFYLHYHQKLWKPFVRSQLFRLNYTVQHLEWTKQYDDEEKKIMDQVKTRSQFLQAIKIESGQALANMVRDMSVSTSTKNKMKSLQLRPTKGQIIQKQFGDLFSNLANQNQKSHKSMKSTERLSKKDRKKVRELIFGQKDLVQKKETYEQLHIIDEKSEVQRNSQRISEADEDEQTEYEYEYIEEEYPVGTDMQQILKGCKKGDAILPL